MKFRVRNVGVITRRNKKKDPCVEDWRHYEHHFMEHKMNRVGCCPPHLRTTSDLPTCNNATYMKPFVKQPGTAEIESFRPPCKVMNRVEYLYDEKDWDIG